MTHLVISHVDGTRVETTIVNRSTTLFVVTLDNRVDTLEVEFEHVALVGHDGLGRKLEASLADHDFDGLGAGRGGQESEGSLEVHVDGG